MIIRMIATALIQCITRTQAGWMTLEGDLVGVCRSVAARLVMMFPSLKAVTLYTPKAEISLLLEPPCAAKASGPYWRSAVTKKRAGVYPGPLVLRLPTGRLGRQLGAASGRRQQDGVDHVDHAVRLMDVSDGDGGGVALGVDDPGLAIGLLHRQLLTFDGLEHLAIGQVGGVEFTGDDMVGENLGQ